MWHRPYKNGSGAVLKGASGPRPQEGHAPSQMVWPPLTPIPNEIFDKCNCHLG